MRLRLNQMYKHMKKPIIIIGLVIAIAVIAGGSFYGGMIYDQKKITSGFAQRMGNISGRNGIPTNINRQGGAMVSGDITAKDDKSITVSLRDGGSKIIFFSDKTEIGKFVSGTATDLEIGKSVTITGTTNSDGSVIAQSIQLRPAITPDGQQPPTGQ